ncbi:MAG: hypothetical protein K9M99_09615 [Candidatus Cloacimonetes bacterium]|nr:hypothetical protein [Candidatus Cloacimonadota bacterium]
MVQERKAEQKTLIEQYDEGLGTVYERFRLNYIFQRLLQSYDIKRILEYPLYGMTGVDGINSVYFARQNIDVELVDCDKHRLEKVQSYWHLLNLEHKLQTYFCPQAEMSNIDLKEQKYDLVWNFAALWFYHDADRIIDRMIKLSRNLVLISVNNIWQPGYPLRKFFLDKEFFSDNQIDTRWVQMPRIRQILRTRGLEILEEGVFDTPPWPDTCLPVDDLKRKLGIKVDSKKKSEWLWSMLAWYAGADPDLENKVRRYMFIEDSFLPKFLKQFWSHHRYIIARKN